MGKEYPHQSHLCMVLSTPCCSKLVSRQPACSCLLIVDLEAHTAFRAAMAGMEREQSCEGPLQEALLASSEGPQASMKAASREQDAQSLRWTYGISSLLRCYAFLSNADRAQALAARPLY